METLTDEILLKILFLTIFVNNKGRDMMYVHVQLILHGNDGLIKET